jgi:hypothetical protein
VRTVFTENEYLLTVPCLLYVFSFVAICVKSGCFCIVRILCMINMAQLEDTVEEESISRISISAEKLFGQIFYPQSWGKFPSQNNRFKF